MEWLYWWLLLPESAGRGSFVVVSVAVDSVFVCSAWFSVSEALLSVKSSAVLLLEVMFWLVFDMVLMESTVL